MLNLREAAELAGTSKSSVFRAIKSGRLSATRTDTGEFRVDPAEVMRAYPPRSPLAEALRNASAERSEVGVKHPEMGSEAPRHAPESEVLALRTEVRLLREIADDLRAQRDKWQQQAERLALAPPQPPAPQPTPVQPPARSWWPWRRSA
jgi:excisionase family DNA binding protein